MAVEVVVVDVELAGEVDPLTGTPDDVDCVIGVGSLPPGVTVDLVCTHVGVVVTDDPDPALLLGNVSVVVSVVVVAVLFVVAVVTVTVFAVVVIVVAAVVVLVVVTVVEVVVVVPGVIVSNVVDVIFITVLDFGFMVWNLVTVELVEVFVKFPVPLDIPYPGPRCMVS